jgi:hypothetical protein
MLIPKNERAGQDEALGRLWQIALTLERKCGYTSGSYAVQIEP